MGRAASIVAVVSCLAVGTAAAAPGPNRPGQPGRGPAGLRAEIEQIEGTSQVWIDAAASGVPGRRLIRETLRPVELELAFADETTRTAIVRWQEGVPAAALARLAEDKGPAGQWFSYSRDGGQTWSEPEPLQTELTLRGGRIEPGRRMPAVPPDLELPADGRLFVVQFNAVALPEWRDALAAAGVELLQHVPQNAFIVRMDPGLIPSTMDLPFVERVEPYHPGYRLEPAVESWLRERGTPGEERRFRVVAVGEDETTKRRLLKAMEDLGGVLPGGMPGGGIFDVWLTRAELHATAALDDVLSIEFTGDPHTAMDLVRQDDGANWLETGLVTGWCGQGVRGEVMDAGFQTTHQDFDGIMLHGSVGVDPHGTAVYGIVFGNGNRDGDGSAQATGNLPCGQGIVASWGCFLDRMTLTQQLKTSPYYASFQTNSWFCGDITNTYTSYARDLDDVAWRQDFAILQAQGNYSTSGSAPFAIGKNVISVGGIRHQNTLSTTDDNWTNGASVGPASDGRIKPDISYWYDNIFTTDMEPGGYAAGLYYSGFNGTSAATPQAAGVLGLIAQMWSENVWRTNPAGSTVFERLPHASTLKALLVNSTQQYTFSGTGHDLTRTHQGWGRPSAQVAKNRAARSLIVNQGVPLQFAQTATYQVDVEPGTADLRVTLVYPDPPAVPGAAVHRINNLDLKVVSPSGTIYYGNNGLAAATTSTSGGTPNTLDTVENVLLANPAVGRWTVEVRAAQINQDGYLGTGAVDAVFSLVVTGAVKAPVDNYYPTANAVSHIASGIANCMGDIYSCHILRDEDVLPLAPTTDIVMHGGGWTGSCSAMGWRCAQPDMDVYINDPTWVWPDWCLANGEAYTLSTTNRYDMRGVSVQGCTPLSFQFSYNYKCTSNAQCLTGHQCNTATGICFDPCFDDDHDGWTICEGDCNDSDPWVNPGQQEVCGNGVDDDCDGNNDAECCYTLNLPNGQCAMCDATEDYVCGPGYHILCCP
jgi:serine protease AprX